MAGEGEQALYLRSTYEKAQHAAKERQGAAGEGAAGGGAGAGGEVPPQWAQAGNTTEFGSRRARGGGASDAPSNEPSHGPRLKKRLEKRLKTLDGGAAFYARLAGQSVLPWLSPPLVPVGMVNGPSLW
jgi:hypothetical protein